MKSAPIILIIFFIFCLNSFSQYNIDPVAYKNKKKAERLYNQGISKVLDEDYYSALFYLDSAIALIPEFAKAYNEKGKIFFVKERYDDAIMEFEKASDLDSSFGEAFFNLAFTYFVKDLHFIQQDSLTISSSDFGRAIDKGYLKPEAYYYRGLMKHLEGDTEGALADYTVALELDNEYIKAYHDRGTAKNQLGDFQGAIYDYRMAVTYDAGLVSGYINMGDAKKQIGDFQGAERDYTVAINIDTTNYIAFNNRGGARFVLGEIDEAAEDFSKAYELDPESAEINSNMGSIENNRGNYDGAIEWFNAALEIDENYAPAILNRGLTYELQGKLEEACADWEKASELGLEQADAYLKECNKE